MLFLDRKNGPNNGPCILGLGTQAIVQGILLVQVYSKEIRRTGERGFGSLTDVRARSAVPPDFGKLQKTLQRLIIEILHDCIRVYMYYTTKLATLWVYEVYIRPCRISISKVKLQPQGSQIIAMILGVESCKLQSSSSPRHLQPHASGTSCASASMLAWGLT